MGVEVVLEAAQTVNHTMEQWAQAETTLFQAVVVETLALQAEVAVVTTIPSLLQALEVVEGAEAMLTQVKPLTEVVEVEGVATGAVVVVVVVELTVVLAEVGVVAAQQE